MRLLKILTINVFLSLAYAVTVFVNSSYLGTFFSPFWVSIIFTLSALAIIGLIFVLPFVITRVHIQDLLLALLMGTTLSFLAMALANSALLLAIFFIINSSLLFFSYYCLDILLEAVTQENETGSIRGIFLTLSNTSIAVAPLSLTLFVQGDELGVVYFIATVLLLLPIILIYNAKHRFKLEKGHLNITHKLPFTLWRQNGSIRRATLARLVLESFYGFMTIYTPIYLHQVMGFYWSELGVVFTIMLVPFILFEWPMGILGDKLLGEKEIMTAGFIVTGLATLSMAWLHDSLLLWTLVLFASRIGASFTEIATESHFFKHVSSKDFSLIAIFRLSRPVGVLLGAIVGGISIVLIPFNMIFLTLGCIVLLGLSQSLTLTDTR